MEDGTSYMGLCKHIEDTYRESIIILWHYQKLDVDDNVLINYWDKPNEQIIINTKSIVRMELIKYTYDN